MTAAVAGVLAAMLAAPLDAVAHGAPRPDLTGSEGLVRVYDHILNADFAQADAELSRACRPAGAAPQEACDVLAATSTWWRILLDPDSRAVDPQFDARVEHAIETTEAWAAREPQNAEAHFYAGAAYAARVQWRVLRDEKIAAARDGKRIKQALERAIALDPSLDDAYFGVGMYQYYADIAPAAAKVLRFLLALPGGDRTEGLARMQRARAEGTLLRGEADYQLHIIYLWYERRPDQAVELLQSLNDRYPRNPLFPAQLADVQDRYLHDIVASLDTWEDLLAAALGGGVNEAGIAEARARLGMAKQLEALHESDRAIGQMRQVIEMKGARPSGALAEAYVGLGEAEDRLGHRDAALAAYRLAIAAAPAPDVQDVRRRAADRMRRAPDAARAEAYRLSIEGVRRLEKKDLAGAESLLARSLSRNPRDAVAWHRYGRVMLAKKDDRAALTAFESAIRVVRDCPAPIAAATYLDAARVHERLGRSDEAIAHYRIASTYFGGGSTTRAAAHRALTRLRASK
jgi:tetratricopeptide (TPR) repeat protein